MASAPLNYLGYKKAALKHLQTCKMLVHHAANNDEVMRNVYYLSGYIIECALYYRYFERHFRGDVYSITPHNNIGGCQLTGYKFHFRFTTNRLFCKHLLQNLPTTYQNDLPNIFKHLGQINGHTPLTPAEQILKRLTEKWDPAVRYQYEATGLTYNRQDVLDYYESAKDLCKKLNIIP